MVSMPVVLDISSDEEADSEKASNQLDYSWIKEFLGVSDGEQEDGDEVVVVGEVNPKQGSKSWKQKVKDVDDDCVVLDGDPDKALTSVTEKANDSDDLLIVGVKGQIACRDYPHPRHLCVQFPFTTTPHEKHCEQCHCFVCDLKAPCVNWGTGLSSVDHCHATDKVEVWKIQRKNSRVGLTLPLPDSEVVGTSAAPPLIIHLTPNSIVQDQACRPPTTHTFASCNSIPQFQPSRLTMNRSCSSILNRTPQNVVSGPNNIRIPSSASYIVPSVFGRCRSQDKGYISAKNRSHPNSFRKHMLGVRNNVRQRDWGHNASNVGSHSVPSHIMHDRAQTVGYTLTIDHSAFASPNNSYHQAAREHDGYQHPVRLSNNRSPRLNNVFPSETLPAHAPQKFDLSNGDSTEAQVFSEPLTQPDDSQSINRLGNISHAVSPCHDGQFGVNQQESWHQVDFWSSYQAGTQSDNARLENPRSNACDQISNIVEQWQSANNAEFSVDNLSWVNDINQSNQPAFGSSQSPNAGSEHLPSIVNWCNMEFAEAKSTNPHLFDFEFENWLLENQPEQGVSDGPMPFGQSILSPERAHIDTGMLLFNDS